MCEYTDTHRERERGGGGKDMVLRGMYVNTGREREKERERERKDRVLRGIYII
jgi:hypothetical protein